tara:strand:+ start:205 stop:858 length:654 start_codon:yes stop_codon:yes gene_type:complete
MATFQTRIEDIIGATVSLGSDDATANQQAIQDALQDTADEIINQLPIDILMQYATKSSNITSNPVVSNLENSRVLNVERRDDDSLYVPCAYITPELGGKIQNRNSIFYSSTESPNWTWNDNDVYVYPEPSASSPVRYYTMETPAVEHDDSSVTKFPNDLESALVLGACVKLKQRQVTFFNEEEDPEIVQLHKSQYQDLKIMYAEALAPYIPAPPQGA